MILVYATFDFGTTDRSDFYEWFAPLATAVREAPGCVTFELLVDPQVPDGGRYFEVWRSEEDLAAHATHPAHVEMIEEGARRWGMRNFDITLWTKAAGHVHFTRESLWQPPPTDGKGEA
jgi:quinol monooxygenase YgiN